MDQQVADEGAQIVANDRDTIDIQCPDKSRQFTANPGGLVVRSPTGFVRVIESLKVECNDAEEARKLLNLENILKQNHANDCI